MPNTLDVLSNIPFLLVFVLGCDVLYGGAVVEYMQIPPPIFADPAVEKPLWLAYFCGIGLVALGSSYYHWKPNNSRLVRKKAVSSPSLSRQYDSSV